MGRRGSCRKNWSGVRSELGRNMTWWTPTPWEPPGGPGTNILQNHPGSCADHLGGPPGWTTAHTQKRYLRTTWVDHGAHPETIPVRSTMTPEQNTQYGVNPIRNKGSFDRQEEPQLLASSYPLNSWSIFCTLNQLV